MVHTLSREQLLQEVDEVLNAHGLTRAEFVEQGREHALVDDEVADLWLTVGPVVADLL